MDFVWNVRNMYYIYWMLFLRKKITKNVSDHSTHLCYTKWIQQMTKKIGKCLFDVIFAFTKKISWFFVEKPCFLKMRTHFYVAAIHMVHASYYMKAKIDFALHLQRIMLTLMLSSVSISLPLSVSPGVLSSLFKYNMLHSPHWFEPT